MENIENIENTFNIKLEGKHATSHGEIYAIVSKNKERQISRFTWYLGKNGYPFTYKRGSRLQLHKLIWILIHKEKPEKKMYIDHINRNKLDATDENLRLSTPAENSYNRTSTSRIIDPYTNEPLHHIKQTGSGYIVSITKNGTMNKINKIATLEEAKEIYNAMATELFGEFAVLY